MQTARAAGRRRPRTALLVECAVDALSAWSLDGLPKLDLLISAAGVAAAMPAWTECLGLEIILCGCDADEAGDRAACRLGLGDKRIRRLRPEGGKDSYEPTAVKTGFPGPLRRTPGIAAISVRAFLSK